MAYTYTLYRYYASERIESAPINSFAVDD